MILKDSDVIRKGDIIHYKNNVSKPYTIQSDLFVAEVHNLAKDIAYVERPEHTPDYKERDKILLLRDALIKIALLAHEGRCPCGIGVYQHALSCPVSIENIAREALEKVE